MRERCLTFDCEGESLLGVLSEPPAPDGGIDTGVLIVVGGLIVLLAMFGWALEPSVADDSDYDPPAEGGGTNKELATIG